MSTGALILSSILILIPLYISFKEKLFLEKEIFISITRAIIQLVIVGYLLEFIFGLNSPIFIVVLVFIMTLNAAINTKSKSGQINNSLGISFISISIGTVVTMAVLIFSGTIDFVANVVIPVSGMIVSNAMVAISLSYRSLNNEFKSRRGEVEVKLSLGADIKDASKNILRESIKLAVMPTIDSAKTLGIVSLPGMMTGLILGGASPIIAIKYQIMVTFMIVSASFISTLAAVYLSYRSFFNKRAQLKIY